MGEGGLTPGQLRHFRAFGYVTVPALLTAPELATAAREFDAGRSDPQIQSLAATPAEAAALLSQQNFTGTGPATPFLASLPEDPRTHGIARQCLGDDCVGATSNGNSVFRPTTEWHPVLTPHLSGDPPT